MDVQALKKRIIDIFLPFNPEKIILFGSFAGNNWDSESDVDLIIVYDTDKRFLKRLEELYTSWNISKPVDILAYTPDEFKAMLKHSIFLQDVIKGSATLYERN
jgi:predicted nucleotidyltransferase